MEFYRSRHGEWERKNWEIRYFHLNKIKKFWCYYGIKLGRKYLQLVIIQTYNKEIKSLLLFMKAIRLYRVAYLELLLPTDLKTHNCFSAKFRDLMEQYLRSFVTYHPQTRQSRQWMFINWSLPKLESYRARVYYFFIFTEGRFQSRWSRPPI